MGRSPPRRPRPWPPERGVRSAPMSRFPSRASQGLTAARPRSRSASSSSMPRRRRSRTASSCVCPATALSFHPRKIVTTGEGGAVTTNDGEIADAIRRLRHHGIEPRGDFDIRAPGLNYRLSDILCAIGISQLRRLEQLLEERERLAAAYAERLETRVGLPTADEGDRHGLQAYVVRIDRRDEALSALREAGIQAQIGTYALHHLGAFRDQGPFPGADACYERALALPFHNRLSEEDIERVSTVLTTM